MEVVNLISLGIIALLVLMALTLGGVLWYSGLFTSVNVGAGAPPIKSLVLVYKFGRGPYNNCMTVFNEAVSIAPKQRCIGLYYDDPKQVPAEKLRWAVGSIIAEGSDFPDTELIGKYMDNGFKIFHTPLISSMVKAEFPYTTALSIYISILRVYPAMGEYVMKMKLSAHPYLEIYDGDKIYFLAPLARQDDFYVPEALEKDEDEEEDDGLDRESSIDSGDTTGDSSRLDDSNLTGISDQTEGSVLLQKSFQNLDEVTTAPVLTHEEIEDQNERSKRGESALSFVTAKSEINDLTEMTAKQAVEEAIQEAVQRIKMDKSTPEGVQDSGISSTSNGNNSNRPTPAPVTHIPDASGDQPIPLDSSSNIGSSATSLVSINSINSSMASQSIVGGGDSHSTISTATTTSSNFVSTEGSSVDDGASSLVELSGSDPDDDEKTVESRESQDKKVESQ